MLISCEHVETVLLVLVVLCDAMRLLCRLCFIGVLMWRIFILWFRTLTEKPVSDSTSLVPISKNLNTSAPDLWLAIVF